MNVPPGNCLWTQRLFSSWIGYPETVFLDRIEKILLNFLHSGENFCLCFCHNYYNLQGTYHICHFGALAKSNSVVLPVGKSCHTTVTKHWICGRKLNYHCVSGWTVKECSPLVTPSKQCSFQFLFHRFPLCTKYLHCNLWAVAWSIPHK